MAPLVLTVPETAAALRVSRGKVFDLIRDEGLPTVQLGRRRLVPVAELAEWLSQKAAS